VVLQRNDSKSIFHALRISSNKSIYVTDTTEKPEQRLHLSGGKGGGIFFVVNFSKFFHTTKVLNSVVTRY
jgi:hypothetical protein